MHARTSGQLVVDRRPAAKPAHGLLPALPRDPALHLVRALVVRRRSSSRSSPGSSRSFTGQLPAGLHRFFCAYVRYTAHLAAYLTLVANPYPPFVGDAGDYPIDVQLPGPERAVPLADPLPALARASRRCFVSSRSAASPFVRIPSTGTAVHVAGRKVRGSERLGPARLVRVRRHRADAARASGRRRLQRRLPERSHSPTCSSSQTAIRARTRRRCSPASSGRRVHPVHLVGDSDDLRRSRVTVFFRLPLAIPHLVWLVLWGILAFLAAILHWFATLFTGRPAGGSAPVPLAVPAVLVARVCVPVPRSEPVPGLPGSRALPARPRAAATGAAEPLEDGFPDPPRDPRVDRHRRTRSGPGRSRPDMVRRDRRRAPPVGLRNYSAYALRYSGQVNAYMLLITETYPHASPLEGAAPEQLAFAEPA